MKRGLRYLHEAQLSTKMCPDMPGHSRHLRTKEEKHFGSLSVERVNRRTLETFDFCLSFFGEADRDDCRNNLFFMATSSPGTFFLFQLEKRLGTKLTLLHWTFRYLGMYESRDRLPRVLHRLCSIAGVYIYIFSKRKILYRCVYLYSMCYLFFWEASCSTLEKAVTTWVLLQTSNQKVLRKSHCQVWE